MDYPERVLITGGSRGIGREAVLECARRGADVVLTYRSDIENAEQSAAEARALGVQVDILRLDLRDSDSIESFGRSVALLDPIDALVLNAGIWAGGRVGVMSDDDWWDVVETNLQGAYSVTKVVLKHLRRSPAATITFVSSVVGIVGFPGDTAYASAKGGMISFARSLAKELVRERIRVNVLAPGFVETEMTAELSTEARRRVMGEIPLGRPGTGLEVAKGLAFLVFDGTYMTGSTLTIDGGWSTG